ncbi:MAG: hypothetical protein ABIH99_02735 [Candidatus Micrarchaeota archaeon]
MKLITKDNLIKLLVVLLILVFMFEILAFAPREPVAPTGGDNGDSGNTQNELIVGTTFFNASVYSYKSELRVTGSNSLLTEKIESLRAEGKVAYTQEPAENITLLVLPSSVKPSDIALELKGFNATTHSRAVLSAPAKLSVATLAGTVEADMELPITLYLDPSIPKGENIQISAEVSVLQNTVYELRSMTIIPENFQTAVVATVTSTTDIHFARCSIAWEDRMLDVSKANSTLASSFTQGAVRSYLPAHIVAVVPENSSSFALKRTEIANLSYVTGIGDLLVQVNESFVDKQKLEEDMDAIFAGESISVTYVNSTLDVLVEDENFSSERLESALSEFNAKSIAELRLVNILLNGKTGVEERELDILGELSSIYYASETAKEGDVILVPIEIQVVANKVVDYTILS